MYKIDNSSISDEKSAFTERSIEKLHGLPNLKHHQETKVYFNYLHNFMRIYLLFYAIFFSN